ncbi:MAG: pyridoxamine 5'-phosphate oxidase family protein [Gemmatimonadota bacterium]
MTSARMARVAMRALFLSVGLCAVPSSPAGAQVATSPAKAPRDLEASARRIVAAVAFATFITTDATGRPQARTVQPLAPDSNWTVWFATNPRTRKVREVARDPRVILHYFDPATLSYVALSGRARIVRDRATKAAHWNRAWDSFYPDRDTSVVLIAVQAERLEIVSSTLGIAGDAATWRPPSITLPRRPRR